MQADDSETLVYLSASKLAELEARPAYPWFIHWALGFAVGVFVGISFATS